MVNPYSAGTLTLQESAKLCLAHQRLNVQPQAREPIVANSNYLARLGGCNVLLARFTRADDLANGVNEAVT